MPAVFSCVAARPQPGVCRFRKGERYMNHERRKKKLPVGIENFEKIRTEGFYYVDKTGLIRDLLYKWGEVNLFTRPRRFGKSLNMNMLKTFFEIGCDSKLFDGLEISKEEELCRDYMGRFPVVSVSLKGVEGDSYEAARHMMVEVINEEARRLSCLAESDKLSLEEKRMFSMLLREDMDDRTVCYSLRKLSELLYRHYETKVIILIDEYDVPLAKANDRGYYEKMITLVRGIFNQALKTNDNLQFAVMTGCLRVARESIFTGLNNPKIFSVTTVRFDEYFGFTDREVREMLEYYGVENRYASVKEWYDGYRFGNVEVYCPWDVINYCDELTDDPEAEPRDYWSNTSGNDIVRHFMERLGKGLTRGEVEALVAGETVTKEIREDLTYNRLYDSTENVWSVLFTTGYLTQRGKREGRKLELAIPNMEIRNLFTEQIMTMFREETEKDGERLEKFCGALEKGEAEEVERLFNGYLGETISIRDTFVRRPLKENFFHGILLGILGFKGNWYVKSNRESGDGYSDIVARVDGGKTGIIIEVKYAENGNCALASQRALEQIEETGYAAELREEGFDTILKYGIGCFKKKCRVAVEREEGSRNL